MIFGNCSVAIQKHRQHAALFAQQDHMQVFKLVLNCLDVFQFCPWSFLYVIRLAGRLKHCSLSVALAGMHGVVPMDKLT